MNGQGVEDSNDSTIMRYMGVFRKTCDSVRSKVFDIVSSVNDKYDKEVLEGISQLLLEFQSSGRLTGARKYFKKSNVGSDQSRNFVDYYCYTTDKKGNLNIFLHHEIDTRKKVNRLTIKILTSSKLYCKEGNWLVANFDAIYFRELLVSVKFKFVLHEWGDELYFTTTAGQ